MLWSVYMNGKDAGFLPFSSVTDAKLTASKYGERFGWASCVYDVRPTSPEATARYEEFMDEYNNWDPWEDVWDPWEDV